MEQIKIWQGLEPWDIILGSQSPRRVELLKGLGLKFRWQAMPDIDESYPPSLSTTEVAPYISQKKAEAYRPMMQADSLLITADTAVLLSEEVLGKPQSEEEAVAMLQALQGQTHSVITGLTLSTLEHTWTAKDETKVHFSPLSEEEIRYYVSEYRPLDKAGAYGIQEWIGYRAIRGIEGSFYTVMGLPTQLLVEGLKNFCR